MIKSIGIRAHDFGKMESHTLAQTVKSNQLDSVQLALNKAIIGIDEIDRPLAEDALSQIGRDFVSADVAISVLGCYLNYAHPNQKQREANLQIFKQHIEYADLLGARLVGTETGSMMADYSYCKDNHSDSAYKVFAQSLYELLDTAEAKGVNLAVEGVWDHIIYDNDRMHQLIKDMQSDRLKVILDPVNFLNVDNYSKHDDMVKASFAMFGDRIQVIHAKDYKLEDKEILEISHGEGLYDYKFLSKAAEEGPEAIDILLENAKVDNLPKILSLFKI